ncbi:MAG: ATP-binding protein [Butyrivibrio sp.]|nr:ATP-binding protein [Oribacterium sp.]MBP3198757.1 ATP-binding protein [Butyrivibrio sp.]MBR1856949.1 ATP-binding protein [Oribacterium sp.]
MSNSNNPYTLMFGKQPVQNIPRLVEMNEVLDSFLNEPANQQIYMITGIRGCGKTVFMTEVAGELKKRKEWEVLELSTSQNLLASMAEALTRENRFTQFLKRGIGVSIAGFGVQLDSSKNSSSPLIAIKETLDALRNHKKKLLICIDEVISNDYMKEFASIFQILIREDYPIYLLMTGLFDNINDLRNEKNLTFLYRAPEIRMKALNIKTIADNYQKIFQITDKQASEMAKLTRGYSFAFQVLGYFTYRHEGNYNDAISEFRQYLEDYVYEKIWSELSNMDRKFMFAVACSESGKAKEIKDKLGWENNKYTPYRNRLIKKMLINGDEYGYIKITLPLFEEYIMRTYED